MLTVVGKATSIKVRKVLWTCTGLGLPFVRAAWQGSHAALKPNRMVPVLVGDGFVLWESNTICCHLCEHHGGHSLLPPDYPHVAAWYARLGARPGFAAWCGNGVA